MSLYESIESMIPDAYDFDWTARYKSLFDLCSMTLETSSNLAGPRGKLSNFRSQWKCFGISRKVILKIMKVLREEIGKLKRDLPDLIHAFGVNKNSQKQLVKQRKLVDLSADVERWVSLNEKCSALR